MTTVNTSNAINAIAGTAYWGEEWAAPTSVWRGSTTDPDTLLTTEKISSDDVLQCLHQLVHARKVNAGNDLYEPYSPGMVAIIGNGGPGKGISDFIFNLKSIGERAYIASRKTATTLPQFLPTIRLLGYPTLANRIQELQDFVAAGTEDCTELHLDSIRDLAIFLSLNRHVAPPMLGITTAGNIQAHWKRHRFESLTIDFHGDGTASISIIARDARGLPETTQGTMEIEKLRDTIAGPVQAPWALR